MFFFFFFFFCWSQSQLSLSRGRVHPGQVASSSQGPHWWQRPPCKVPTAHKEQFGVQYLGHFDLQLSPELGFEPVTLRSLTDLLYPLSWDDIRITVCRFGQKHVLNALKCTWLLHFTSSFAAVRIAMATRGLCQTRKVKLGSNKLLAQTSSSKMAVFLRYSRWYV